MNQSGDDLVTGVLDRRVQCGAPTLELPKEPGAVPSRVGGGSPVGRPQEVGQAGAAVLLLGGLCEESVESAVGVVRAGQPCGSRGGDGGIIGRVGAPADADGADDPAVLAQHKATGENGNGP